MNTTTPNTQGVYRDTSPYQPDWTADPDRIAAIHDILKTGDFDFYSVNSMLIDVRSELGLEEDELTYGEFAASFGEAIKDALMNTAITIASTLEESIEDHGEDDRPLHETAVRHAMGTILGTYYHTAVFEMLILHMKRNLGMKITKHRKAKLDSITMYGMAHEATLVIPALREYFHSEIIEMGMRGDES